MNKNLKYGLYVLSALIGGFILVKIVKSIKDNADDGGVGGVGDKSLPTPVDPIKPKAARAAELTAQQIKIEELQSLLGFVGADIDHDIGKNTKKRYDDLNLGLNITLSNSTSTEDLQKIINAIVAKNNADKQLPIMLATKERARLMVIAWAANPKAVLKATQTTKLWEVFFDKTTNKYVANGTMAYIVGPERNHDRNTLQVVSQITGFNYPNYILFKNNLGEYLVTNPNMWILK